MKVFKIRTTTRRFANGFDQVFNTLEWLQANPLSVELDFASCTFINPSLLLPLVALKESSNFAHRLVIDSEKFPPNTALYLRTVHFPRPFKAEMMTANELSAFLNGYRHKSYIPIIAFPGSNSNSAAAQRDLVISSIGTLMTASLKLSVEAHTAIMMLISELTDNIGDHADADSGFLFAQHYPSNGYMDICIADCGIGILRSFKKNKPLITASGDAINRAVRGESTKGLGRGYGISGSINMLGSIGGEFILLSGNSSFVKRRNRLGATVDMPNYVSWTGCLVLIRIPTTVPKHFSIYQYYS